MRNPFRRKRDVRTPVHFLHIGKTAGTQITHIMDTLDLGSYRFVKHPHSVTLRDIPTDEAYFFSIREPISRFYSGFYSRLRKGRPRYNSDWSLAEERAFQVFPHANDLAEALDPQHKNYDEARVAMLDIGHVNMPLSLWFAGFHNVLVERPPVYIVRQENFAEDFKSFLNRLDVTDWREPAQDPVTAHKNDYATAVPLSAKALKNLREYFADDIALYNYFLTWEGFETS